MATKPKTTTAKAKAEKPTPKKKAEKSTPPPAKPEPKPKVPRIPPFVNGEPTKEVSRVPLTDAEVTTKMYTMLEMLREQDDLKSEFESVKASFKHRIKSKAEDITKIQSIMASRSEETEVAVYWRYFPKKKIKRKHIAGSGKPIGQALPMTPDELKKFMQPDLLTVPAAPKPVAETPATPFPDAIGQGPGGESIPPPKESTLELDEDEENPEGTEEFQPED